MIHAMDGGLWLHRHVWKGRPMAHLISTDRELLLAYGRRVGLPAARLQYKTHVPERDGKHGTGISAVPFCLPPTPIASRMRA
jgi:hypothetical protein